ncbi:Zgc:154015 protein, related [Neospora caninum Liverpool]|uniref:Defective in cullin neddylation protein n=1 Tax=Neospora caninum (strain Liverpool) TaxID=572307 RepID=F0VKM9_NEOCL|nr:Zgc:154015 protein, related [Neospora caninum Liverpool]CBZ54630.1 Zgc:154015 protein, related [Neospora caninum Liverpool]CEL69346.1 TPA: Zgc:154015 protein, related [Neospora caninum Liverpool]|eukprot:XP_003884660.1 Zgc:154015 protein, related [Neospora caninum Liverpool]
MASRGSGALPSGRTQQTLETFQSVTGCTDRAGAAEFLRRHSFDLSRAVDAYFAMSSRDQKVMQQPRRTPPSHSSYGNISAVSASYGSSSRGRAAAKARADDRYRQISETFEAYAQRDGPSSAPGDAGREGDGAIEVAGLERLAEDLGVGLDDVFFLVFAFFCECAEQGRITKEEFTRGMDRSGVCTAAALREVVPQIRARLSEDKALARQVYSYAFTYSLDVGQKALPLDLCVAYWRLLLCESEFPLMTEWYDFIEEEHRKRASALSKDPWIMLFDFMHAQRSSVSLDDYDEDGAWPLVIDEFVDWARRRRKEKERERAELEGSAQL